MCYEQSLYRIAPNYLKWLIFFSINPEVKKTFLRLPFWLFYILQKQYLNKSYVRIYLSSLRTVYQCRTCEVCVVLSPAFHNLYVLHIGNTD